MFNLIKKLLNGTINTTSIELSEEKESNMFNFTTNLPELDKENSNLFKASAILETMGNQPGLTADQFYRELALSECSEEDLQSVTLAAIAIETMMTLDLSAYEGIEPTIH
jgi:hypothetical protein